MKRILILALLLLSIAGVSQAQDTANWTILVYGAFDNDLEAFGFSDYYEMQTAGSGDGVHIVVQADRAEGHDDRFGDWTDTRRFYIEQGRCRPKSIAIASVRQWRLILWRMAATKLKPGWRKSLLLMMNRSAASMMTTI